MTGTDTAPPVAVILAAGSGQRFGGSKQLARYKGETLVRRATRVAREACGEHTLLVVGHNAERVIAAVGDLAGFVVINERHSDGLGRSLATAVAASRHAAGGYLVILADQPLVTAEHLCTLLGAWRENRDAIVVTASGGRPGPPAIFPPAAFDDLTALQGDRGARALFSDARFGTIQVPFEPAGIDIDRPGDLENI